MSLRRSNDSIIKSNTAIDNTEDGIRIRMSTSNMILGNTINENDEAGIELRYVN